MDDDEDSLWLTPRRYDGLEWNDFPRNQPNTLQNMLPTSIRVTVIDKNNNKKTLTDCKIAVGDKSPFMNVDFGESENGVEVVYDPYNVRVREPNLAQIVALTLDDLLEGDRVKKIEFNFSIFPRANFTVLKQLTLEGFWGWYTESAVNSNGTPVLMLTSDSDKLYHAIWNGVSWDVYYLPVDYLWQVTYAGISIDDFNEVHYFDLGLVQNEHTRTSWNVNDGWYDQFVVYATDAWSYSKAVALDNNGYTHLVNVLRRLSDNSYYINDYYQDASGWHNELLVEFGVSPAYKYFKQYSRLAFDNYNRLHFMITAEETSSGLQGILYVTNANVPLTTEFLLGVEYVEASKVPRLVNFWIDKDDNNHMYYLVSILSQDTLKLFDKAWSSSSWTETEIGSEYTEVRFAEKHNNLLHMLEALSLDGPGMGYHQYDLGTKTFLKTGLRVYGDVIIRDDWPGVRCQRFSSTFFMKDGKPTFAQMDSDQVGFQTVEINE
jgi:hypothetical protein